MLVKETLREREVVVGLVVVGLVALHRQGQLHCYGDLLLHTGHCGLSNL